MYKVEFYHLRPYYRNGDLEQQEVLISSNVYKTKKIAKSNVLWQANGHNYKENWHTGNTPSYVYWYTNKRWTNENTGEVITERFTYKITKI